MYVDAGELNKRIGIYKVTRQRDAEGYWTTDKTQVRSTWAKLSQMSVTDTLKANADTAEVRVRFLIRWSRHTITRKMLVSYGHPLSESQWYEVEYVNPYGDNREYIELLCRQVTLEDEYGN